MRIVLVVALSLTASFVATPALAKTPKTTPKATATPVAAASPSASPVASPAPSPTATPADDELPTVGDDEPGDAAGAGGDEWGLGDASKTIVLGLRGGYHAFADVGSGGPAFEVSAAMPLKGPWHGAIVAGYHTGFHEVNSKKSFFDAEFGAVEGQYRHNVGPVNLFHGLGLGVIAGNSAEVVQSDGEPGDSGIGPVAHLITGFYYPMGRMGFVGQLKYGFAPVNFRQVGETLPMGGLTVGLGFDFGF